MHVIQQGVRSSSWVMSLSIMTAVIEAGRAVVVQVSERKFARITVN